MERSVPNKSAAVAMAIAILAVIATTTTMAQDFTEEEKAQFVKLHNDARAAVGVSNMPEVSWDETVAAKALEHASTCSTEHIKGPYGENLWWGWSSATGWVGTPTDAMKFWVDEKQFYDYGSNQCVGGECRHYTQVVWSRTTAIGCGRVTNCNINGQTSTLIACNYNPGGNIGGEKPY
uniref:SCP domain-containing protein n=1 Tax=Leersia perrieri TaxID=77586 RepID=A0A0D9WV53_9ORYZ